LSKTWVRIARIICIKIALTELKTRKGEMISMHAVIPGLWQIL